MRGDAGFGKAQHDMLADMVVQHALAADHILLLRVEGGGVVLEILNQCRVIRPRIDDFGLPLIQGLAIHGFKCTHDVAPPNTRAKMVSTWRKC